MCVSRLSHNPSPLSRIGSLSNHLLLSPLLSQVYTLFGILFLAFLLLALVTSFVVIALTYFQLAVEDYRWCGVGLHPWVLGASRGLGDASCLFGVCVYDCGRRCVWVGVSCVCVVCGVCVVSMLVMFASGACAVVVVAVGAACV
jgi:hypothetical protein